MRTWKSKASVSNDGSAGSLLKEAIEDLEWVAGSGSVSMTVHRQPPSVSLSAHSAGSLEVKILVGAFPANISYEC